MTDSVPLGLGFSGCTAGLSVLESDGLPELLSSGVSGVVGFSGSVTAGFSGSSVGLLRTYPYTQAAATTAMIAITAIITFERFIVNASFLLQAYCTKPDGKIQRGYTV